MRILQWSGRVCLGLLLVAVASFGISSVKPGQASAACSALPTDKGQVVNTVSIPATSSYRVWTRIKTADSTKNSVYMQIDSTTCNVVVGGASLTADTWTWVDYQSGTSSNKIDVSLASGSHTVTMAGKDDGVMVDRVIFTQDTSCVPTGTGDNCANPPDTTAPTVSITSPANNANISSTTTITANATDDVAISKVEFYVDGVLKGNGTSAGSNNYTFSFNPASYALGAHVITAKAYDTAGTPNTTTSTGVTVNVLDTTAPTVSVTAPTAGATVSGSINLTANASDNVGISKVEFYVDGALKGSATSSPYTISLDTTTLTNASHSITAKAYDTAATPNTTTSSPATTVTVSNSTCGSETTAPSVSVTAPTAGATISGSAFSFTATATDTCGIKQVQLYVDNVLKATDTSAPYSFTLDTTGLSNGTHQFKAVATDNSTNQNQATSTVVNATVNNVTYAPADIDQNGHVGLSDFSILATNYGKTRAASSNPRADIDGNGTVGLSDFSILATNYGT